MFESISTLSTSQERGENAATCGTRPEVANLPGGAFFEGRWQNAELTLEVQDPQDNSVVGRVCTSTPGDVKQAIAHIHRHLQVQDWPLRDRREALEKAVALLERQFTRFATIIAAESSKTINEAEREVRRCMETLRLSAAASEELAGATLGFEDSLAAGTKVGWYSRLALLRRSRRSMIR
jgi:glyceraldehyde-3-phosphate dehydrogenase (NADP+)